MISCKKTAFEQAVEYLSPIKAQMLSLPKNIIQTAQEIRLRANRPIIIQTPCGMYKTGIIVGAEDLAQCMQAFCDYSIHSFGRELCGGYITLRGGHRAGFCGTAIYTDNKISTIKDISSINLRIAREHLGCALEIEDRLFGTSAPKGLLIAGTPLSGKTTVLRDLCRLLGERYKLSVIDERGEIGGVYKGEPQLDVGINTDILNGFDKSDGFICAIRAMSPQYIVCDEIGQQAQNVAECMNNGTGIIVTAHCADKYEAQMSQNITTLLKTGAISHVVFLGNGAETGKLKEIWEVSSFGADWTLCGDFSDRNGNRDFLLQKAGKASSAVEAINRYG